MSNNNLSSNDSIEESRKEKAKNFKMNYDKEYDYDTSDEDINFDDADEINSYSDEDTKARIEKESKKALKKQKKEEKKIEKSKAKRNKVMFKWIWLIMIIFVAIILSQVIYAGVSDMLAINRENNPTTVKVTIPKNPTLDGIADELASKGVIDRPDVFKMYFNLTSDMDYFYPGDFKISTGKDYEAIINYLQSDVNRTIVSVQVTEGMNIIEISNLLKENKVINNEEEFQNLCNSDEFDEDYTFLKEIKNKDKRYFKLEGYLFPDTYDFYLAQEPKEVIDKFLSNFDDKIVQHEEKYFGHSKRSTLADEAKKSSYSLDEIINIASIIQAEASNREDMYNVSSIIHNRLKSDVDSGVSTLNLDSTVFYPYRTKEDLPDSIKNTYVSDYDTNKFMGLPPGPICNPSFDAIKAALNPNDTDYLYFCHSSIEDGSVPYYASNLEDHEYNLSLIE